MGFQPHLRVRDKRQLRDPSGEPPDGDFTPAWPDFVFALWNPWNLFSLIWLHFLGLGVLASAVSISYSDPPLSRWVAPESLEAAASKALDLLRRNRWRFKRLLRLYGRAFAQDRDELAAAVRQGTLQASWLKDNMENDLEALSAVARWAREQGATDVKIDLS